MMAELLGGKVILESLKTDVQDIQWAITEITSRIGPVQNSSWKFPDKLSCDLDIEDLLDLYSFSDDEEECQVAHIALYELVIDRFVYFVQTLSAYNKQSLTKAGQDSTESKGTSVGVVVKQHCNKQIQLQTAVQQTFSDIKTKSRRLEELEKNMKKFSDDIMSQQEDGSSYHTGSVSSLNSVGRFSAKSNSNIHPAIYTARQFDEIARDANSKSTQTVETAFVPCESCHVVQKNFRHSGDIVIAMCKNQQLPCSLQQFRPLVADVKWLSANDVARWASEQNKDLSRVHKNMDNLVERIASLKEEVASYEKKCKELKKRVTNFDSDMSKEREVQAAIRRQCDIKVKDIEHDHREEMAVVTMEKDQLSSNKSFLEKHLNQLKADLEQQQNALKNIEQDKRTLEKQLKDKKFEEVERLQSDVSSLQVNFDEAKTKYEKSSKELSRELAKNRSSAKHGKSLQSKQDSLLKRVDLLDQENEELKSQYAILEEEKENAEETLEKAMEDVKKWETKVKEDEKLISHLSTEKEKLQDSISCLEKDIKQLEQRVQESTERERLIIEYPDLNGPVNPDLTGTGDILCDMQNQVKANLVRIQVLEEQNGGLRNSISKVMTLQQGMPSQAWADQASKPLPLWNFDNLSSAQNGPATESNWNQDKSVYEKNNSSSNHGNGQEKSHSSTKSKITSSAPHIGSHDNKTPPPGNSPQKIGSEEFLVGRGSRPPSSSKRRDGSSSGPGSRPQSGKMTMAPVNSNSISAYIQMKKAAVQGLNKDYNKAPRLPSAKNKTFVKEAAPSEVGSVYSKSDMFSCERCDKMYSRFRDLEIHKSYCTA